jgi:hypothetical protein
MDRKSSQLDGFLTRVHRRMVLLRLVECVGLGVLIGSGAALALLPVLVWRGLGTMPLVVGCLGLGALGGILWGVTRRPNRLAAAVEADRQLKLADLLGTAFFLRRSSGELDEIARSVLATAEARSAGLRASMVIVNRIGVRGWGGIALTCGLVLVVGVITAGDRAAEANGGGGEGRMMSWQDEEAVRREQGNEAPSVAERDTRRVKPAAGGDDEDPLASGTAELRKPGPADAGRRDSGGTGMSSEGTGAGAARSAVKASPGQGLSASAGGNERGGAGTSSSGAGAATRGASGAPGGTSGGGVEARRAAPVWSSEQWARDREAALRAVQGGEVPDDYRGLVRDYFERK